MLRRDWQWAGLPLAIISIIGLVTSQTIVTDGEMLVHNATVGSTVRMECAVRNVGSQKVTWQFIEHNLHISSGYEILTNQSSEQRYSIQRPADGAANTNYYTLVITNLQTLDHGHYKCAIDGTSVSTVHSLRVSGAVTPPTVPDVGASYNFTDCCVAENISSACLPACSPTTVSVNFNPIEACANDLFTILKCASEGKNHAGCCKRRLVPDKCLDLCVGRLPKNADKTYYSCLNSIMDMYACAEQGRGLLPSAPQAVSVVASADPNSIVLTWQGPRDNAQLVIGYRIHYKVRNKQDYMSTSLINQNEQMYTLHNLAVGTKYVLYLTAISDHGSSQASESVYATTRTATSTQFKNETIYECCGRRSVSTMCQSLLCTTDVMTRLDPEVVLVNCSNDFSNVKACFVGERDQSACCRRMNVPDHCLGFCNGDEVIFSWNITQCIMRMPIIEGCIEEGRDIIPSAPVQFKLVNLRTYTAEFSWSRSGKAMPTMYDVFYKWILNLPTQNLPPQPQTDYTKITVSGNTEVVIAGLSPLTHYEAFVVARNENYTSLPTAPIRFLTYGVTPTPPGGTTTPPPTPSLFYNYTGCCIARNMSTKCLPLCDYEQYTTSVNYMLAFECSEHILSLLICGADGRNHEICCKERGLDEGCLPLCSVTKYDDLPDTIHNNPIMCARFTMDIAKCYIEGIVALPMPVESVRVFLVTPHVISLSWDKASRGPLADNYTVLYMEAWSDRTAKWLSQTATRVPFHLNNLNDDTRYKIQIVSVNENGSSAPSSQISVATLPYYEGKNCSYDRHGNTTIVYNGSMTTPTVSSTVDNVAQCEAACNITDTTSGSCVGFVYGSKSCTRIFTKDGISTKLHMGVDYYIKKCAQIGFPNITVNETMVWKNRTHCCQNSGISADCQPVCMTEAQLQSPLICENDFNKVLACVADGRDHSRCCRANGVPSTCVGYCQGQALPQDAVAALCVSYTNIYLSCFSLGLVNLPTPPQDFRVIEKHARYIMMAWKTPADNCDAGCTYVLSYTPDGGSTVYKRTTDTKYNITSLMPETRYSISVSAYNSNGSSLPSPQISVLTFHDNFMYISVFQSPSGIVDQYRNVELICDAYGTPLPSVSWISNRKTWDTRKLDVNATDKTEGLYSCVATVPGVTTSTRTLSLNVRYAPTISSIKGDKVVDVDQGYTAVLECDYRGFPTSVTWLKGEVSLPLGYRVWWSQVPNYDKHELQSRLEIANVHEADLGTYTCMGSNAFGSHNGTVTLKKTYISPTPAPTITPLPATNVTACCADRLVSTVCMDLCTFRLNLGLVATDPNKYSQCVEYFEDYVICATDGKDHTLCCNKNGVSTFCQDFCGNNVPDLENAQIYSCIDQTNTILNCLEEGRENIPSPPVNVVAEWNADVIDVQWDPPKDYNHVEYYQVWYTYNTLQTNHATVPNTTLHWTLKHLDMTTYSFWVIAKNDVGQSLKGKASPLRILGIRPSEPLNVWGKLQNNNEVVVTWTRPVRGLPVVDYTLTYTTTATTYKKSTTATTLTLTGLNFGASYAITVVANNEYGQGRVSAQVTIETSTAPKPTQPTQPSKTNAGLIVGVVVVLLVVIAVAVLGLLYVRKRGFTFKSGGRSEAVSFENPQYGSGGIGGQVQISGLPGEQSPEAAEQKNFDYCPLKEDTEFENSLYDNAATLSVDQVGLNMKH